MSQDSIGVSNNSNDDHQIIITDDEDEQDDEIISSSNDTYQQNIQNNNDDADINDVYINDDDSDEEILEIEEPSNNQLDSLTREFNLSKQNEANISTKTKVTKKNNKQVDIVDVIEDEDEDEDEEDEDSNNEKIDEDPENQWKGSSYQGSNQKIADEKEENLEDEEIEEDELEVTDQQQTQANAQSNGQANTSNNSQSKGLFGFLKHNGHYNARPIIGLILVGGFIFAIMFSISTSKPDDKSKKDKSNLPAPEQVKVVENSGENNELEPVATKYFPTVDKPSEPTPLPTVTIPPVPPTPLEQPTKGQAPVGTEKPVKEESKEFGIELRAGTAAALKTLTPTKENEEKGQETALDGLTIPMILLEPFRSGISTIVKAQVLSDVINPKGEVLVRANSIVKMPFERFEIGGRVMNAADQPVLIILPNGKKLAVKGIVKGADGFAGIKGSVKKLSKGNVFGRFGKTLARGGARTVGVLTGGFTGRGIEDTINESVDSNTEFTTTGRIVEILPGTKFNFIAN